jgi:hypothetical protein
VRNVGVLTERSFIRHYFIKNIHFISKFTYNKKCRKITIILRKNRI